MKIVIDIPKYIFDTVVEYTIVDADKDEIQKAIRNGQILPDNSDIIDDSGRVIKQDSWSE